MDTFENWICRGLRLTAFPVPGEVFTQDGADRLFLEFTGEECESYTKTPREKVEVASGAHGGEHFIVEIDAVRVNWKIEVVPANPFSVAPDSIRLLDIDEKLARLKQVVVGLPGRFPVVRFALGLALALPTPGPIESYERLAAIFPSLGLRPGETSDFRLQINRPRESACVGGLRLNKLATWTPVSMSSVFMVQLAPERMSEPTIQVVHEVRLELDLNTAGERSEQLPDDVLAGLFDELHAAGRDVALRGDV